MRRRRRLEHPPQNIVSGRFVGHLRHMGTCGDIHTQRYITLRNDIAGVTVKARQNRFAVANLP
jgi:hypothetical protein